MTNKQLVDEIFDNLVNDSDNPGRMLAHIDDNCEWTLQPGNITYKGRKAISEFIDVAMASRGAKRSEKPTKVKVVSHFANQDSTYYCFEFDHKFSFGSKVPGLGKRASKMSVQHCNVYRISDGKIMTVHEYTSSPYWWLNLSMQLVLKRMHTKVQRAQ